ncbi:MAG TPA: hypothetical protein VL752_13140 [Acidisoma sp.]|uniref:hypothetical protein n=1 Tax=Acidisoma sp. TaxID=1872115 RepID=UPI002C5089F4|nr:hypothetical protein [Acidisoma sp.]HTI01885.1 hypothetical protein [Acidisoma sp.]
MAQCEANGRSLARNVVLPPSLAQPVCREKNTETETDRAGEGEAEDAEIIAARLGGVAQFG